MTGPPLLWDSVNEKRVGGKDPVARAFDILVRGGPGQATRAMEKAGRELGSATRRRDPEAVLVSAYLLVVDGKAAAARRFLRDYDDVCREHGDLAYMRGEAELRAGFGPLAAVRARGWLRLARDLGVSANVKLTPLRQGAQAAILLGAGLLLAVAAAAARPLAPSWRAIGVAAGFGVAVPGLLRQLALHRAYALLLFVAYVGLAVVALR